MKKPTVKLSLRRSVKRSIKSKGETDLYETRKRNHLALALKPSNQATIPMSEAYRQFLQNSHQPILNCNFSEITLDSVKDSQFSVLRNKLKTPFFVSGMTAGVKQAQRINENLARACARRGWILGLGSLRQEIESGVDRYQITKLKEQNPDLVFMGNLGASQLSILGADFVLKQLDRLGWLKTLDAFCIHLNPLQEVIQVEGTPQFKNWLPQFSKLIHRSSLPMILKETGCGLSVESMKALVKNAQLLEGLAALDVSGVGGTHWGRIEGDRAQQARKAKHARAAEVFKFWGVSTEDSLRNAVEALRADSTFKGTEIWASGGVRDGLYASFLRKLGAQRVGFAKPALEAAQVSTIKVEEFMEQIEFEARITTFLTSSYET